MNKSKIKMALHFILCTAASFVFIYISVFFGG